MLLSVLAIAGLSPTPETDTVIETLLDGSLSISQVPHSRPPAVADTGSDEYSRLDWSALCGLLGRLCEVLVPSRACAAIPQLAEGAREWLLGRPCSPEMRAALLEAPADLRLVAAASATSRAQGEGWDVATLAQRLGIVQVADAAQLAGAPVPAAAPTWSPAQALAVEGLEALGNVARTLGAAVATSDPQRFTAARPTLEPAIINAMERLNAWEESRPAGAEQVHPAYPWEG